MSSDTTRISWEYLMPKRRERAGRYIRESNERLVVGTTTMESGTKLVNEYCAKQGYICEPEHEWREAISAVEVPYMQRKKLLEMLDAAKKGLIDVLVVPEIRALARRQVEVLVIYDMLQKYGVRLETVKERFGEDAMSKAILSLRAMFVEIEVEQNKMRMQRGRADRMAIGGAPNAHPKAAYGYRFINTEKEVKGGYEFNHTILFVDSEGTQWSEYQVVVFIFDLFAQGRSINAICRELNRLQIPPPKKALKGEPHWQKGSLYSILTNPIYCGEVWANRFKNVRSEQTGKPITVPRPPDEWIRLPDCPAIITKKQFEAVKMQLAINREESIRNNSHPKEELGLLRCGHIVCGICGRKMHLAYPSPSQRKYYLPPTYECEQVVGNAPGRDRHRVKIGVPTLDLEVRAAIRDVLTHPSWVREKVAEMRKKPQPVITEEDIQATINGIKKKMKNLYNLAEKATDDETIADLAQRMNGLEKQKRDAELLLFAATETDEQDEAVEAELQRFEKWVIDVKELTDPNYSPTYEELRLAVRVLGIKATVWPTKGDYEYRWRIDATVPAVLQKVGCDKIDPSVMTQPSFFTWTI